MASTDVATSSPSAAIDVTDTSAQAVVDKAGKTKKRLFGFGKKKSPTSSPESTTPTQSQRAAGVPSLSNDTSKLSTFSTTQTSSEGRVASPVSPRRALSTSPRLSSPAGSQIFERDVQDGTVNPSSPAIPTHFKTDNHIPPVLDDASEAITNGSLDPDTVEIVTHSAHQPASINVTGAGASTADQSSTEWADELASFANRIGLSADTASNYGSLDSGEVRRLSFISFADVVQSEQASATSPIVRDNMSLTGMASLPASRMNRSPSPMRSPVSSQGPGTSPPTSSPGSIKGLELSPARKHLGSPGSAHGHLNLSGAGDLNIETMRQALRRTGSRDMSAIRSTPASPIDGPGSR